MKKILMLGALLASMFVFTGCSTIFSPESTGEVAGIGLYVGYSDAVDHELIGHDVQDRVNKLWAQIQTFNKIEDLVKVSDELSKAFDEVIASKKLSDRQKDNLTALKNVIMGKVNEVINDKLTPNTQAVEFLCGVRTGVNIMIYNGKREKVEKESIKALVVPANTTAEVKSTSAATTTTTANTAATATK